jgi:FdhD protein
MLATPTCLEAFGLGFSLTEGIIQQASEMREIEVAVACDGVEVQMEIPPQRFAALKEKRRSMAGRTGCGLCGAESLAHVIRHPDPVQSSLLVKTTHLHAAFRQLLRQQPLQSKTGAVHAAAWVMDDGRITHVAEDVGRHNALDKLIGFLAMDHMDVQAGFVIVTSRASYEMVQKSVVFGITFLAAISAPTALAIRLAQETRLTLVGFTREESHVVYANEERLLPEK